MVLQILCYPFGAILSRTEAICSKRMRRLGSVKVDCLLGERYISQHVRRMRSSIASVINSTLVFRCAVFYIFCNE